ncbi:tyrosine-type recombinase/integrase [Candidatus Liberibacter solanacearum]|uniref:tyrosine-type recombinase/integrase n=1 Tax=Candidatus Liberibacter solanacearum TaxID=556287 RepID=UPI0009B92F39|nr:tyrosine-type recombinase/integrase [Candidatus Liberibacter solanacearum]
MYWKSVLNIPIRYKVRNRGVVRSLIWFKNQCKKADLPNQCTAHGLRKAGATIMANAGVSSHELMAMYGWSKLAMAEIYTKEVDKKKLSSSAIELLSKSI